MLGTFLLFICIQKIFWVNKAVKNFKAKQIMNMKMKLSRTNHIVPNKHFAGDYLTNDLFW